MKGSDRSDRVIAGEVTQVIPSGHIHKYMIPPRILDAVQETGKDLVVVRPEAYSWWKDVLEHVPLIAVSCPDIVTLLVDHAVWQKGDRVRLSASPYMAQVRNLHVVDEGGTA